MKYFLDTEFIERPCTIDLLSVGIVAEDGRQFYAEASDADHSQASDWVKENVIAHLWHKHEEFTEDEALGWNGLSGGFLTKHEIGLGIRLFIRDEKPEFWGYYADYDWVVFCWLQGTMMDLPKGWPMYCRDIKQLCDALGNPKLPGNKGNHNALADAIWTKEAYHFLRNF